MIKFTQKNIIDVCLGTKTIQAGYFGTTLVYQKSSPGPSTDPYITFTANEPSTIRLLRKSSVHTLEYSTDKTNWNTMDTSTSISLNTDDNVYVRGILSANNSSSDYTQFSITGNVSALGNINAVWNYQDLTASLRGYCGYYLFYNCTGLHDINDLQLPATTLGYSCYSSMFNGCTSLTTVPTNLLPATTADMNCYSSMFKRCTALTNVPNLPAIIVGQLSYASMFERCTSLTTVPTNLLPATTLGNGCYDGMFEGCTSLTNVPNLPATNLSNGLCYSNMFYGCTSLTTVPTNLLPSTTLGYSCYYSMFKGCTALTNVPNLPSTTLGYECYYAMFSGCTSLTTVPTNLLPATDLGDYYNNRECYSSMFSGCTSLTTAPDLPATSLTNSCYSSMFNGCTSLTTAPDLPATSLYINSYRYMFRNCSSLNYIKCLATDISAVNCTYNWLSGVANSGTFVKDASMNDWTTGISGIPSGWTVQNA